MVIPYKMTEETRPMSTNLHRRLNVRFMNQLLSTPRGRAHVLSHAADAESNGEGGVFDRALAVVDDPEIARLIKRHQADEVRHAEMFRACVERTGVRAPPVPDELKVIDRLDRALGGFFDRPLAGRRGVMDAYLILQVIEERAVTQFALFEPILRRFDPQSADVLVAIGKDEERHLKYCRAIARRYAPDPVTERSELTRYRIIEARVYAENSLANLKYTLDHGLVEASAVDRVLWRGLAAVGGIVGGDQRTPFWGDAQAHEQNTRELAVAA
jgi:rubrerythrin